MRNYYEPGTWNAICTCCGIEKDSSQFYLHSNGKPRKRCKECHYARSKEWVAKNRDALNEKNRSMSEEQREKARNATSSWRKNNLAYDAFRARTYRARKQQQLPVWANLEQIKEIYLRCPRGMHVDHIVPLRGKYVSGLHVANNLQYLTPLENYRKRNLYA